MKKRLLIGVIITECNVDFQEELMRGIISQAFKSNCDVAVINALNNFYMKSTHKMAEKDIFKLILSDKFDGFLYDRNTFLNEDIREYIDSLLKNSKKPVMLMDSGEHRSFETTSVDDCSAFEIITDHLINVHGLKKIYCLTGPKNIFVSCERLKGYKNSMKKNGLYFDKSYMYYGNFWKDSAVKLARKIISGEIEKPEAVVCGNDVSAIALVNEFIKNGIKVPEDIAVTGYDASVEGYQFSPAITSYSRPNYQLGAEAFRRLYRIITGNICNKVPSENGSLRLGKSCGCDENIHIRNKIIRKTSINREYEAGLFYGDMLFDITNAENYTQFAEKIDNYTYFIHKMRYVSICLTKKYILSHERNEKLDFNIGDEVAEILSKSTVNRSESVGKYFSSNELLPVFNSERNYPVAYYISLLHYNNNFFGYVSVSFGKIPMAFSTLYLQWINYVNIALEQMRIRSVMNYTVSNANKALLYDEKTGMLNRNGIEKKFTEYISLNPSLAENAECIRIQLTGLSKTYFQSGEEKCEKIFNAFSEAVLLCVENNEICACWNNNVICIITFSPERAENIFKNLCIKIKENHEENLNVDFFVGSCSLRGNISLSDAMHKSAVNRLYTYNISENTENPQFEKICLLRNKIMKNPEKPWNISEIADELYLSKSYVQKIYKSYFGKGIIEEMIIFRIEKAKNYLSDTDMTVTEIARECGYSSYNYFVRQFRMTEGISPSEYRNGIK
ncbi:MAG: substrate-binding domain-containing protein [Ruminococcus sp.]|nr:substrate-binding domain-containing protein [Ruminococcus sp.]